MTSKDHDEIDYIITPKDNIRRHCIVCNKVQLIYVTHTLEGFSLVHCSVCQFEMNRREITE